MSLAELVWIAGDRPSHLWSLGLAPLVNLATLGVAESSRSETPYVGQAAVRRMSLGLLDDLDETPPLRGAQRPGLHQEDAVADAGGVLLVVGLELARAAQDLAVERVLHAVLDLDDDGLVHLVADDEPLADLAAVAVGGLHLSHLRPPRSCSHPARRGCRARAHAPRCRSGRCPS